VVPVDFDSVAEHDGCTPESHAADKRAFAPTLVYRDVQRDEHGVPELELYDCALCHSTLAIPFAAPAPRAPRRIIVAVAPPPDLRELALAEYLALLHRLDADAQGDMQIAETIGAGIARRAGLVDIAIFTENRQPRVIAARTDLCIVLRRGGWSYPRIGRAIGRHHTSVMSLLEQQVDHVNA
jgi:hypothetical protein